MRISFSFIAEDADSELEDFKALLDYVSLKSPKVCSALNIVEIYFVFSV